MLVTFEKIASQINQDIFICPADYPYLYSKDDATKIYEYKTWSKKRKIDTLLHVDCNLYCNLGCDSTITERKEVKQSNIIIAYRIPGLYDTDNFKLEVLSEYLGGGMSSILFQKIRTRLGLAYTIRTEIELYEEGGVFMIYAGTDKKNTETVVAKILEEVDKLLKVFLNYDRF